MKRNSKGFDYCYNAQATVDGEHQINVAAEITNAANDKQQAVPMAQAAVTNIAAAGIERPRDEHGQPLPIPNTADSGYFSAANVQGVTDAGVDPYFAVGRDKHHAPKAAPGSDVPSVSADAAPAPSASSVTADENPKTAMAKKVRTARHRVLWRIHRWS